MTKLAGFTLIELMIVIVVIAVLSAIAIPSYQSHICKVERGEAKADLLSFAQAFEKYSSTHNFRFVDSENNVPNIFPAFSPSDGNASSKKFDLTASITNSGRGFLLTATRAGGSCQDGSLTINHKAERTWVRNGNTQSSWDE